MRQELLKILDRHCAEIARQIDPDSGFLRELLSKGVLTREQLDRCKAKETPSDKVEEAIRSLRLCPDEYYNVFCDVVKNYRPDFNLPRWPSSDQSC
jgi:hypothetical protein